MQILIVDTGVPMIALSVTEGLVHALYPEYAKIMWNFAKHYSQDPETGAIKYNPNKNKKVFPIATLLFYGHEICHRFVTSIVLKSWFQEHYLGGCG
jgi:hypothetical protein